MTFGHEELLTRRGERSGIRVVIAVHSTALGPALVGSALAGRLAAHGAELLVSDIDSGRREDAERLGARWVEPEAEMLSKCDVLAPCALGGAIDQTNVNLLRCQIVCGSANNILADEALADRLRERGI